jgi:hypothetical protein
MRGSASGPASKITSVNLADRTLSEISERIVYLERSARMRMAEWLAYVGEFDARRASHLRGFASTAHWLAFECSMELRTAREHVRVARRLRELPRVAEAFALTQLSYSKVRAISRVDDVEDEQALLSVALNSTASQLEQHVRQLRSAPSADLDVAERNHARRFLQHFFDDDGALRFFGSLPADTGAAFAEAIETTAERIHSTSGGSCCHSDAHARASIAARRADAIVELITGGGIQTQIVLHADPAALACTAQGDEPRAGEILYLRDGPAIPSEMARRLSCDAKITIHGLNRGRTTSTVSPAQRRALEARDGRICSMPGCTRTHGLDAHHIVPWALGGKTDLDNLALVCGYHHTFFHEHGWTLRRRRNGALEIKDPRGVQLHELPRPVLTPPLAAVP